MDYEEIKDTFMRIIREEVSGRAELSDRLIEMGVDDEGYDLLLEELETEFKISLRDVYLDDIETFDDLLGEIKDRLE